MKRFIILFISCLLLASCASKPPKKAGNPGDLYVDGVNLMKKKKYDDAIKKFSEIRENYPFDPFAFIATVKLGDAYFEKKDYVLASGIYEDFFNSHPEDENIPYVLMRLGGCYEKVSLSIDRDQAYTLKAIERFTYLKNRFSTSTYTKDSEEKIKKLTQKLADRELYVGEFYYKTSQYNASVLRLEYFLKKYAGAKGTDKALFYLSMSNRELDNMEKVDYYSDILKKEYPKSIFARSTIRERKTLKLAKADKPLLPHEERKIRDIELRPQIARVEKEEKDKKVDEKGDEKKDEKGKGLSFFDEKKPIDIVSDTMEGFDKEKYVVFKGSVIAKQEDLFIFSDTIEAYMDEATNEIEKAHAKGNVKIVKKERTATSNEAVFDNKKGEIVLKGNVVVFSGPDKVTGDLVTYYLKEDRIVVQGEKEKKARITVTPKQNQ
jgi:outer membrane protein assembly factor BamD